MSDSEIIDSLGGTYKVAALCDTSPQAVSQWRENGIPDARKQFLSVLFPEKVSYIPRAERQEAA